MPTPTTWPQRALPLIALVVFALLVGVAFAAIRIYDQATAPGGMVRFKTILSHIESRLHRSTRMQISHRLSVTAQLTRQVLVRLRVCS